jgi:2-polyprenyl-3-methyl-5-hydroxy-6-metoxy-1,4-benzoquinol methylase
MYVIGLFYNRLYSKNKAVFGKGSLIAADILKHVKPEGKLLDLGIGQGSIAIPLGKAGFSIVGVDISKVGLSQFLKKAQKEKIVAKVIQSNFKKFIFEEMFDVIVSNASLQFLRNKNQISKVITNIQNNTKKGGFNYISVPTQTKKAIRFPYLFKNEVELREYYKDWKIAYCDELEEKYSNNKIGTTARLLAKKI